jgi:hypothetical protein
MIQELTFVHPMNIYLKQKEKQEYQGVGERYFNNITTLNTSKCLHNTCSDIIGEMGQFFNTQGRNLAVFITSGDSNRIEVSTQLKGIIGQKT